MTIEEIEEIEKRISVFPEEMTWKEANVPLRVRDPNDPKRMIIDPHGRMIQTRMDIVCKKNSITGPFAHFHKMPDHPNFFQNWKEVGDAIMQLPKDAKNLILENKRLTAELAVLKGLSNAFLD